jgi:methionyl-tRNA formyltransferase
MGNHIFVNIHPSLLPDLKGKSPILEALKQNKPMGVTCHVMIDEVDSGDIISQVKVFPDRSDLNDCYKKMFKAEARAFKLALDRNFKPI